jgi:hypothetical protein
MTTYVVLVCGGRDFADEALFDREMDRIHKDKSITRIVHGDAAGADSLAELWARRHGIQTVAYPADWETLGRAAGPLRNQRMLVEERPDVVVAFPGGSGTANMVRLAEEAGVLVLRPKR